MLQSDLHHSNFFYLLPPAVFFGFLAFNGPGSQSLVLAAGRLSGRYAALPAATEVRSDDDGAYRTHAKAISQACEYALKLDVTNLWFLSLPTVF